MRLLNETALLYLPKRQEPSKHLPHQWVHNLHDHKSSPYENTTGTGITVVLCTSDYDWCLRRRRCTDKKEVSIGVKVAIIPPDCKGKLIRVWKIHLNTSCGLFSIPFNFWGYPAPSRPGNL